MQPGLLRSVLVLGLLVVGGPLAIDMYLPVLPAISRDLGAPVEAVQATLAAYFLAFGLAQIVYGPWSDAVGRKPPLYAGLTIFILGSAICAAAPSVGVLIAGRVVQAMGAAVLMVVPRAIVRDRYTGADATRVMATMMLIISVSPMLAPLIGSGLAALAGWRSIFAVLAAMALFSMALTKFALAETIAERHPIDLRAMARGARVLLGDRHFMVLTFVNGVGMASFFIFLAQSSFVYTDQFGLSPTGFSLAFAVNALGFFGASQVAAPLGRRFGLERMVLLATCGFALASVTTFLLVATLGASLPLLMVGLFAGNACLGLVIPTSMVLALEPHGRIAGLASSLGGTLQMVTGAVAVALSGLAFDGTAMPMIGAIALCGVAAAALALLGRRGPVAVAAAE